MAHQPSKADRKEEIIKAAAKFFASRGYHGTQLEELARSLGLSKGALYWYFPNGKKQIFVEACRYTVTRVEERLQRVLAVEDPLQRIKDGLHAFLRFCRNNRHFVELIIHERGLVHEEPHLVRLREKHIDLLVQTIKDARKKGLVRSDVKPEDVALLVSCTVFGAMFLYLEGEADLEEMAAVIAEFLLRAIRKQRKRREGEQG